MIVSMDIGTIEDTFLLKPTIPTTSAIILNEKQVPSVINKINGVLGHRYHKIPQAGSDVDSECLLWAFENLR
jgi:hypothetical protein